MCLFIESVVGRKGSFLPIFSVIQATVEFVYMPQYCHLCCLSFQGSCQSRASFPIEG